MFPHLRVSASHLPARVSPFPSGSAPQHAYVCSRTCLAVLSLSHRGVLLTCQGMLSVPDALDDHPGLVLLEAGWALKIGPAVLQDIVVNLAVLLWHVPDQRHTVVCHEGLCQVDDGGTGHCQGPGEKGQLLCRGLPW